MIVCLHGSRPKSARRTQLSIRKAQGPVASFMLRSGEDVLWTSDLTSVMNNYVKVLEHSEGANVSFDDSLFERP